MIVINQQLFPPLDFGIAPLLGKLPSELLKLLLFSNYTQINLADVTKPNFDSA